MMDTTFGVLIAYCFLKISEYISKNQGWTKVLSGNYSEDTDEDIDFAAWALQLMIWVSIIAVTKWILLVIITFFNGFFIEIGNFALRPFFGTPKLELIFVMIIVPTIMNIFQFWVQDNFLKSND